MENIIGEIKRTIFEIEKPFEMEELYSKLKEKGINNKILILKVLDTLLDEGLVSYDSIKDATPTYKTLFCV